MGRKHHTALVALLTFGAFMPRDSSADEQFCRVRVQVECSQHRGYGTWLYTVKVTNPTDADLSLIITAFDDAQKSMGWQPRTIKASQSAPVLKEQPAPNGGTGKGHVSVVKVIACPADRRYSSQCSKYCNADAESELITCSDGG